MEGKYEIMDGGRCVGQVQVKRQGLYLQFSCRCRLTGEVMHKLVVTCGGQEESLGICVPMGDAFGLEKRIPAKRLGNGVPEFQLLPKHDDLREKFIPISPEEPFAYIRRLENAHLARRNGRMGVMIQISSSSPTGQ